MSPKPKRQPNRLELFRLKRRFTTEHVTRLLGLSDVSTIQKYERGERLPSLPAGLRLAVILRTPVEFLFPALFDGIRREVRAEEERLSGPIQQELPLSVTDDQHERHT